MDKMKTKASKDQYDVVIIGGGITGAATLYALARHTNLARIALVEKEKELARVNTHRDNNAQTLHEGDIETNYRPEKARKVRDAAALVARYVERYPEPGLCMRAHKLVLAIGIEEIALLRKHYEGVKGIFPGLRLIDGKEIARIEPEVMEGRDPKESVLALYAEEGYAIDYGMLARSLVAQAQRSRTRVDVVRDAKASGIVRADDGYKVRLQGRTLRARAIVVAAGAHSLPIAHALGYGREWALLPVAGTFYSSKKTVSGKVYRVQRGSIPFSAPHADPDVADPSLTRYGPLAKVVPMLERGNAASALEFFRLGEFRPRVLLALARVLSRKEYFRYMCLQALYATPLLGRWLFLREMRRIVPTLRLADLSRSRALGGIRPQMLDVRARRLVMGEAKLLGERAIFDITPSPGASVCLENARQNAREVVRMLGADARFDDAGFMRALGPAGRAAARRGSPRTPSSRARRPRPSRRARVNG